MKEGCEGRTARKRHRPFSTNHASSSTASSALQCSTKPALRTTQKRIFTILILVAITFFVSFARITRHHSMATLRFNDQVSQAKSKKQGRSSSLMAKCSCWNNTSDECCDRKILRAHKMGVVLIRDLIQNPFHVESAIIHPSRIANQTKPDYRHVVITRPIYDSIISGYLYHKSGRECWLDQNGNARSKNKTFEWESKLSQTPRKPPRNRTLCAFLAEESEQDGVSVVVDLALSAWYAGLVPHKKLVEQVETNDNRHTLFVCFEELSNPTTQRTTLQKIMNWLYPGGHDFSMPLEAKQASYKGGHSTTSDAAVRKRLYGLVKRYDEELFNGIGATASSMFGCDKKSV